MTPFVTIIALGLFAFIFIRQLASAITKQPLRFRIADLIVLTTAVGLMCGIGRFFDAAALGSLIPYTAIVGRLWKWRGPAAFTLGSFFGLLTIASVIVAGIAPKAAWHFGAAYIGIFASAVISFLCLVGDNAKSDFHLILIGIPFGLPINITLGAIIGAALEWTVMAWRCEFSKQSRSDSR